MRYIALLVCAAAVCNLASARTNTLDSLKSAYEQDRLVIQMTAEQQKKDSVKQYGKSMDGVMTALKEKGDIDGYLVVEKEKKRFVAEGTLPDDTKAIPVLASAIQQYQKAVAVGDATRGQKTAVLMKNYVASLDALIKSLMKADKMADAKAVKDERDKVAGELAELKSKLPPAAEQKDGDGASPSGSQGFHNVTWISKDATYTVSSVQYPPLPSLLTGEASLYGPFSFHTADGDKDPHIVIDLGAPKTIAKLSIGNRANAPERARSLAVWLSDSRSFDGRPFWKADKVRDEWTVILQRPTKARYIKLGLVEGGILHLRVVKVFGWDIGQEAGAASKSPAEIAGSGAMRSAESDAVPRGGRRLVLWNENNGAGGNSGTKTVDIKLLSKGRTVYEKKDFEVAWDPRKDAKSAFGLPALVYDTIHIDVTEWHHYCGGFAEIEVYDGAKNIAPSCKVTASVSRDVRTPDKVIDGNTSSAEPNVGYWILDEGKGGWIELALPAR